VNDDIFGDIVGDISRESGVEREKVVPALLVAGLLVLKFLTTQDVRPAWLKDAPPIHGRRAGPWRGKGSFGSHFGVQAKHR
jgi:hypothetical protein